MDLATMRIRVRRDLKDEDSIRWSDDELDRHIQHATLDIAQAVPLEAKDESLVIPTPASREIDLSSVTGLIYVEAVEYPTAQYPKRYRGFKVWGSILELLIDELPTAAASLYLYYGKMHALTALGTTAWEASTAYSLGDIVVPTVGKETGFEYECTTAGTSDASEPTWPTYGGATVADSTVTWTCRSASTLPGHLEDLCAVGAGAYAALEWASYAINQVNVGGDPTPREYLEWAQRRLDFYHKELKRYGRQARLKIRQLYAEPR